MSGNDLLQLQERSVKHFPQLGSFSRLYFLLTILFNSGSVFQLYPSAGITGLAGHACYVPVKH